MLRKGIKIEITSKFTCLETPSLWRYKENYVTRNVPETFLDFRETGSFFLSRIPAIDNYNISKTKPPLKVFKVERESLCSILNSGPSYGQTLKHGGFAGINSTRRDCLCTLGLKAPWNLGWTAKAHKNNKCELTWFQFKKMDLFALFLKWYQWVEVKVYDISLAKCQAWQRGIRR